MYHYRLFTTSGLAFSEFYRLFIASDDIELTFINIDPDGSGPAPARNYLLLRNVTPTQLSPTDFIFSQR